MGKNSKIINESYTISMGVHRKLYNKFIKIKLHFKILSNFQNYNKLQILSFIKKLLQITKLQRIKKHTSN